MMLARRTLYLLVFMVFLVELAVSEPQDNRSTREDICANLCRCIPEHNFSRVECQLIESKEYQFNDDLLLPSDATKLNVQLGSHSRLHIHEKFLGRSRINHLTIRGTYMISRGANSVRNGEERLVIGKGAFDGNNAPLPEIELFNLHTIILKDYAFENINHLGEFDLNITEAWDVLISENVFRKTTFQATFNRIRELQLNERSFSGSRDSKVHIMYSYLRSLNKIDASLKELKIENSEIETIKRNSMDVLTIDSLILKDSKIDLIESKAITEKLLSKYVAVIRCEINKFEAEAISGSGISDFQFEYNRINTIRERSIDFTGGTVSLSHNVIKHLDQDWFHCKDWSKINISNNTFGNFRNMIIDSSSNFESCIFQHNSMTEASDDSFSSFSAQCQIKELLFYRTCTCTFHHFLKVLFPKTSDAKFASMRRESYCRVSETLMHCFDTSILNYERYNKDICDSTSKNKQLNCQKKPVTRIPDAFLHPSELSDQDGMFNYIFILLGLAAVSFVAICSTFTYCLITKKMSSCMRDENQNHYTINETPQTTLHSLPIDPPPSYQASLRSMKTFTNKDHLIIKRTLDRMKEKQPPEHYDLVYNNTKRLLNDPLNEYEKVRLIGDIVQTIGECENSGEDFVAFTDILYKHLAPDSNEHVLNVQLPPSTLEAVYAEPILQTTVPVNEHIYAEPANLSQQQTMMPLLLANNYSRPVDESLGNNMGANEYSEPVKNIVPGSTFRPQVTPYAISQDIQQPSTSKNLPDILPRSQEPSSSAIARIDRSPNSNRKIPEYTMPQKVRVTQDTIEDWSDESLESSHHSNHSGGSNDTVKMDDLILYADS